MLPTAAASALQVEAYKRWILASILASTADAPVLAPASSASHHAHASGGGGGSAGGNNPDAFPAPPSFVTGALGKALPRCGEAYTTLARHFLGATGLITPKANASSTSSDATPDALSAGAFRAMITTAQEHVATFTADGTWDMVRAVCELAPVHRVQALKRVYTVARTDAVVEAMCARDAADATESLGRWVSGCIVNVNTAFLHCC